LRFYDLLSRAKREILKELLGSATVRLLQLLDPSLTTLDRLREILLNLHSPESLLLSKKSRDRLFKFLSPQEAEILAIILSAPEDEDDYRALQQVKIRRGSENERTLFDFFELIVPAREEVKEVRSSEQIAPQYSLFAHQRQAAKQVKQHLQQEPRRVLLHMPTGAGKTRTAMNIISDHLRSHEPTLVIWLAYSEELCEQAVAEFQKAWQYLGDRELPIYRFWGDRDLDLEKAKDGVVVAGLTKVYNSAKRSIRFINQLSSRSSLVIIDEAHQAIAETYRLVLDALVIPYPQTSLLGLTATPERIWSDINADAKLSEFFAQHKVTLSIPSYDNPIDYLVAEGYLAKAEYRSLLYQSGLELSQRDLTKIGEELDLPSYLLHRIEEDEQRNLRIILEIEELAERHQQPSCQLSFKLSLGEGFTVFNNNFEPLFILGDWDSCWQKIRVAIAINHHF
jgi:superfamily II DNA or RNA helicase